MEAQEKWSILLLASDESVERLYCQQRTFLARKVLEVTVGGALRTIYAVSIPTYLPGDYRVDARRNGMLVADHIMLNPTRVGAAQC
ncbi:hypothetical protein [Kitasatospora sp. NPDC005748]|uniref:hypothetical protein n=1 Tax=Kitasatospora sp. NPDC005748 TaxID=3157063 RepID=UPI003402205E